MSSESSLQRHPETVRVLQPDFLAFKFSLTHKFVTKESLSLICVVRLMYIVQADQLVSSYAQNGTRNGPFTEALNYMRQSIDNLEPVLPMVTHLLIFPYRSTVIPSRHGRSRPVKASHGPVLKRSLPPQGIFQT
jgi:hypothetical protein